MNEDQEIIKTISELIENVGSDYLNFSPQEKVVALLSLKKACYATYKEKVLKILPLKNYYSLCWSTLDKSKADLVNSSGVNIVFALESQSFEEIVFEEEFYIVERKTPPVFSEKERLCDREEMYNVPTDWFQRNLKWENWNIKDDLSLLPQIVKDEVVRRIRNKPFEKYYYFNVRFSRYPQKLKDYFIA